MATYAIGDIQGCFDELQLLLQDINFDRNVDVLWFTGDLVNRGPESAEVIRFVKSLGERAITVLGNHDLHLLAVHSGEIPKKKSDTFTDVINAGDGDALCQWLRHQPLLHHDPASGYTLVHAGIHPQWDLELAQHCAHEVEIMLRSDSYHEFFEHMYGNEPNYWNESLRGWKRMRFITNCFTRMRYCNVDGKLDLKVKSPVGTQPADYMPWFAIPERANKGAKIIFGHWASLQGHADTENIFAIDTGCCWGNCLTALRLDDQKKFCISCDHLAQRKLP